MLFLILLVFGLGLYFYSYRCLDAPISSTFRFVLTGSRFLFLAAMLFLLTRPTLKEDRSITLYPNLYILLDDSLSMAQPVRPGENTEEEKPSRWELTLQSLQEDDLIDRWQDEGYNLRFGLLSGLSAQEHESGVWNTTLPNYASPIFPFTNLSGAIQHFNQNRNDETPSYLLLFSDGQYNHGKNPLAETNSLLAAETNAPGLPEQSYQEKRIFTFGIGTTVSVFDIMLDSVQAPSTVRANDALQVNTYLRIHGDSPTDSITIDLNVVRADEEPVFTDSKTISIQAQQEETSVQFTIPPLEQGEYQYTLAVDPLPSELFQDNNSQTQGLRVRQAQDRVLMLTTAPNWEFKFLKRALENQDTLFVESFFMHENGISRLGDRVWAMRQAGQQPNEWEAANATTLEELQPLLSSYSSLILHNFLLPPEQIELSQQMGQYVENGGGILFLPGSANTDPITSVIAEALPPALSQRVSETPTYIQVSPQAELLSNLLTNPPSSLPPLFPYYEFERRGLTGQTMLEGILSNDQTVPIITMERYGLGTIITTHTDSLWQWRMLMEEGFLSRLWLKLLYELNPRLADREHHLYTDGFLYQVLEPVEVRYVADSDVADATRSGVPVQVSTPSGRESLWLSEAASPNRFQGQFTPTEPGEYQFAGPAGSASATIRVEQNPRELFDIRQNVGLLRELAERTGGEYANEPAWKELSDQLPKSSKVIQQTESHFLGEKWWMAALLIAMLGFEWFLRWRQGLP